jgi:hypothetical protein
VLGTPLAWWLARTRSRWPSRSPPLVAMPLVLPPSVLGFYLLVLMGPHGPVGQLTQALGLGRLPFTFAGLVLGSVLYSLPFVVQPLQQAFEAIPESARWKPPPRCAPGRWTASSASRCRWRGPAADGQRAGLCAHGGRIRRGADDRRQHPRPDARAVGGRSTTTSRRWNTPQAHRLAGRHGGVCAGVLVTLYWLQPPRAGAAHERAALIEARWHLPAGGFTLDVDLRCPAPASRRCSAPRAAARPRCCARWPGWNAPQAGALVVGGQVWQDDAAPASGCPRTGARWAT